MSRSCWLINVLCIAFHVRFYLLITSGGVMRIGIPAETRPGETRVAATPETVKKLAVKHQIVVQAGAGLAASVTDAAYAAAGATIVDREQAYAADVILKVRAPSADERALIKPDTVVIGMLNPFDAD